MQSTALVLVVKIPYPGPMMLPVQVFGIQISKAFVIYLHIPRCPTSKGGGDEVLVKHTIKNDSPRPQHTDPLECLAASAEEAT